jgi:hypothetical protein
VYYFQFLLVFSANRFNRDISLLVAGCETFSSALLDRRLRSGQSAVKRSSAGGSLIFFFLISIAVFFFLALVHLWNGFSSCLFGKT